MTIRELRQKLIKKELSVSEVVQNYLKKIEKEDKKIHSFLTLAPELALEQARKAQEKINRETKSNSFKSQDNFTGKIPLLCGVPCAIKDNILVEGIKCTAGSKILQDYIASYDATVIKRLKEAGAIILGKTNLDEFAMGSSTENSAFAITRNPRDLTRVPGGSSGGSAAAVASDFCAFALGSDTGGSIRQPAAFCGIVGLKPTYGAVSRYGLVAMASSLDQIGPITNNIEEAKIIFDIIKGRDPLDSTSVELKIKNREPRIKNLRIGIPKEYFVEGVEEAVMERLEKTIKIFQKIGIKTFNISLPHTEYALPTYSVIMASEASTNLARYDGIRYGLAKSRISALPTARSSTKSQNIFDFYSEIRGKYFGKEVRRRIVLGTFALSVGYYDEYYLRAQKVRRLIKEDFDKVFSKIDLILTPVSPTLPFKIGEKIDDPIKMYLADIFTVGASLAGLPAISLPCGRVDNLPVGIQLIGKPFQEPTILKVGEIFEKNNLLCP